MEEIMDDRELADKVITHAKCLSVAPEEAIIETMTKAAAGLNAQADIIEYQTEEIAKLKRDIALLYDKQEDSFWVWQGDGTDELSSLSCPVLIRAEDLRELADTIIYPIKRDPTKHITYHPVVNTKDDYDRAMDNDSQDDYDRAMGGV